MRAFSNNSPTHSFKNTFCTGGTTVIFSLIVGYTIPANTSLLQWSRVTLGVLVALMAGMHFIINRDSLALIIGITAFAAAFTSGLNMLFIPTENEARTASFLWTLSTGFNASLLLICAIVYESFFLNTKPSARRFRAGVLVILASGAFISACYWTLRNISLHESLILTLHLDYFIKKPFDGFTCLLFIISGYLLYKTHTRAPSALLRILILSLLPSITIQLYLAFGWNIIWKHPYDSAYAMQLISYLTLFGGFLFLYKRLNKELINERVANRTQKHQLDQRDQVIQEQKNEIRNLNSKAKYLRQVKYDFLTSMHHQIQTPMNGIMGMAHVLRDSCTEANQINCTESIIKSSERLLLLLGDIMYFSSIEAGNVKGQKTSFDMKALIESLVKEFGSDARKKGLELLIYFSPDFPKYIVGHKEHIKKVFQNVISNAIHYTDRGYIHISVKGKVVGNGVKYYAEVKDTGKGIEDSQIAFIFNQFLYMDPFAKKSSMSTGLGLAICRSLLRLMEGKMGVSSHVGTGSTFWFNFLLPMDKEAYARGANKEVSLEAKRLEGTHILFVDDSDFSRKTTYEMLTDLDIRVTLAKNRNEALRILNKPDKDIDLAIIDYEMPKMDGVELVQELKKDLKFCRLPIVMVTSSTESADLERIHKAKVSNCLIKPLEQGELIQTMEAILTKGESINFVPQLKALSKKRRRGFSDSMPTQFRDTQILLVDDNRINLEVTRLMLKRYGADVTCVSSGHEGLIAVKSTTYDLILMDCNMPEMDGFETTLSIRAFEKDTYAPPTPIIAFTINNVLKDNEKYYRAGMDDALNKPFQPQELEDILMKWIPKDKWDVNANQTAPHAAVLPTLDPQTIRQIKTFLEDKFEPIVNQYINNSKDLITRIAQALDNNDSEQLLYGIETLKSLSKQMGALRLTETLSEIEETATQQKFEGLSEKLEKAYMELTEVHQKLANA